MKPVLSSDAVDKRTLRAPAAEGMVAGHRSWAKDKLMFWPKTVAMATERIAAPLLPTMMLVRGIGRGSQLCF